MNFIPKAGPLVAEILSGSAVLILGYFAITYGGQVPPTLHENLAAAISMFALLAWLLGTFFDAVRNILEGIWGRLSPVQWDFFLHGASEELANLDHYFFSFYMLDADLAIGLSLYLVFGWYFIREVLGQEVHLPGAIYVVLAIVVLVFAADARSLRCEIKKYIDDSEKLRGQKSET